MITEFKTFENLNFLKDYDADAFMEELHSILKKGSPEDLVLLVKHSQKGVSIKESINIGDDVYFIGYGNISKNTKFNVKEISGDDCFVWNSDNRNRMNRKGLYRLPKNTLSKIPHEIITNEVDPYGEEMWDDYLDQDMNITRLSDYVIRVNDKDYISLNMLDASISIILNKNIYGNNNIENNLMNTFKKICDSNNSFDTFEMYHIANPVYLWGYKWPNFSKLMRKIKNELKKFKLFEQLNSDIDLYGEEIWNNSDEPIQTGDYLIAKEDIIEEGELEFIKGRTYRGRHVL